MKRTKRTRRMLSNHRCITEEDLDRQNSREMSNAEQKTVADKILICPQCKKVSGKFWASH